MCRKKIVEIHRTSPIDVIHSQSMGANGVLKWAKKKFSANCIDLARHKSNRNTHLLCLSILSSTLLALAFHHANHHAGEIFYHGSSSKKGEQKDYSGISNFREEYEIPCQR